MTYETRDGQGALFPNGRKIQDNHPDYTGEIRIKGELYRLAAWKKTSRGGLPYLSLSIRSDYQPAAQVQPKVPPAHVSYTRDEDEFDREIPF